MAPRDAFDTLEEVLASEERPSLDHVRKALEVAGEDEQEFREVVTHMQDFFGFTVNFAENYLLFTRPLVGDFVAALREYKRAQERPGESEITLEDLKSGLE